MCSRVFVSFNFYLYLSTDKYNFITERKQFFDDMVRAHNDFRKLHQVDDLDLDEQVSYNIFYLFFV